MKLPKEFTTITPFSKYLSMVLFIIFPFLGFYLGMKYQQILSKPQLMIKPSLSTTALTSPTPRLELIEPSQTIPISPFSIPSIDISNWLLYTSANDDFTMKYPSNFLIKDIVTYEGGGTEKYIADSQDSINKWQSNNENMLTDKNIVIDPLYLVLPYSDAQNHTADEKLQKIVNLDLGAVGCKTVTWVNQNGNACQTGPAFTRLIIDNKPGARVTTTDGVIYIILNGDTYLKLQAMPNNSVFIPVFDRMVSTLHFTQN